MNAFGHIKRLNAVCVGLREILQAPRRAKWKGSDLQVFASMLRRLSLIAAAMIAATVSAQAAGPCADITASDVEVSIEAPDGLESGNPFSLSWRSDAFDCDAAHYLIIALPERVRFSGEGAFALAPNESAPFEIAYRADAMRLAVPLHEEGGSAGAISVIPFITGTLALDWAIAIVEPGGTRIVEGGSVNAELNAGQPKIVIQDIYASERPTETVLSASGDFRLDVFNGFFRVTDTLTGALVVAAEGYRPGFSPSSRFLHVFGDKASQFRVFDLYSESLVLDLDREGAGGRGFFVQGLEWSQGDTFLLVAYEAAGAVGFNEMLFDKPYRYRAVRCGACSPEEAIVAIDAEQALVVLDGAVYSLLGAEAAAEFDGSQDSPLSRVLERAGLEISDLSPSADPVKGEPRWFFNGARTASLDYRTGNPIFMAGDETSPADQTDEAIVGDWEALRRGAVALGRTEIVNRDTRISQRLSAFGIDLQPTTLLISERLTFLYMLEDFDSYDDEDYERARDLYRVEPGRAAMARGLASAETAEAIDKAVFSLTRDHDACGRASPHRAFDGQAQLWSWKQGERLHQVVQYYCYVSTGAIPAGIAFLITSEGGRADYAVLAETLDGEMELEGSYDLHPWVPEDKAQSLVDIQMYGPLRVFRPGGQLLALLNSQGSLAVYDMRRQRMLFSVNEVAEFANVVNFAATLDGAHIVQINDNGSFFAYAISTGGQALAGRYLDDEVVVFDSDLRFDATAEGASHVHLKFPGDRNLYQLRQFEASLRAPGMGPMRLKGQAGSVNSTISAPPAIALKLAPEQPGGAFVKLQVEAAAAGGLRDIVIYRDGKAVEIISVEGRSAVIERDIPVHAQTRWLAARAREAGGIVSTGAEVAVDLAARAKAVPAGRLFAVAVGTDTYDDPGISRLNYAASDARAFAAALDKAGSGYYSEKFLEVLEDVPNLSEALPAAIAASVSQMTANDTLFVHIAGHGMLGEDGGLYLADRATRIDDVQGTALAWSQLSDALSSAPGRIFIFLDACHSGSAGMTTNDEAVDSLLASSDASITVIAASKGRQFSFEGARFAGGAFTSALAAIFSDVEAYDENGNGVVEFSELYRALKHRVVSDTEGEQIPWVSRSGLVGDAPVL